MISPVSDDQRLETGLPVVIILGAAVLPDGQPSPALRRRIMAGLAWAERQGSQPMFLVTGGVGDFPPSEADVMAGVLTEHGVEPSRIILEQRAKTTLGSVALCRDMLREYPPSTPVYLCSHRYHLPRASLSFRAAGVEIAGIIAAVDDGRETGLRRWVYQRLREAPGMVFDTAVALGLRWNLPVRWVFRRTRL